MRFGWIGFHREGLPAFEAVLNAGTSVELAVSLDDSQLAKRSGAGPLDMLCEQHGVPLHKVKHINDPKSIELLQERDLDVVFVIGWSQIVGPQAMRTAKLGMIGAHAAVLPHNRGSAPVNWAIIRGETQAGNTLLWLNEEVDEGDVIDQVSFPITPYDTCATIYDKVAESNRDMILRLLPKLMAGEKPGRPQTPSHEEILPRRRPKDGLIDWSKSSRDVYNFIRALTRPYPGAFSWLHGTRFLVWDAMLLPDDPYPGRRPGEVIGAAFSPYPGAVCGQVVACGSGAIVLLEIQHAGEDALAGSQLAEQTKKGMTWQNE